VLSELQHQGLGSHVFCSNTCTALHNISENSILGTCPCEIFKSHAESYMIVFICISALISGAISSVLLNTLTYYSGGKIPKNIFVVLVTLMWAGEVRTGIWWRDLIERDHLSTRAISFYFRNFHFGMGNQSTNTTRGKFLNNRV